MPIYEYECLACKHRFEVIQKFDEARVSHCTVCGSPVQRLLSAPAIQFKGTGWYITDYARKGETTTSAERSDSKDKGTGSSASKESSDGSTTKSD